MLADVSPDMEPNDAPAPDAADWLGCAVLRAKCEALFQSVKHQANVTPDALDAMRPGGLHNPDASSHGWLEYLLQLSRWHAQGPQAASAGVQKWDPRELADLRDTLAEEPVFVPMHDGTTRSVHPKGDYAMHRIALIDAALRWVAPRRVAVETAEPSPAMLDTLRDFIALQTDLEREFVWIVTHPSPDVPWADSDVWEHAAPEWTRAYGGVDLLTLRAAYIEVNYRRLNTLAERTRALAGISDDSGMTQEAFTGVIAAELGLSPREIIHKWSRGMTTAMAFTRWEAAEKADARAKEQAA